MPIVAIEASQQQDDAYALVDDTGTLSLSVGGAVQQIAKIETIEAGAGPISISLCEPHACVVERFGLRGSVVDLRTRAVRKIQREDYHADVSSFSHAFLSRNGAPCLIHQTQWNRLDIMDLETGRCTTDRRVTRILEPEKRDPSGAIIQPKRDEAENYLDYFHSRLHVSPNGQTMLSNGWAWAPVDTIIAFRVAEFIETYELSSIQTEFGGGYNWDRPCAFIDDDVFAVIVDNQCDGVVGALDSYLPLWFYRISDRSVRPGASYGLNAHRKVPCEAFGTNKYGEVYGNLYYDAERICLVAVSDRGGFRLTLDGATLAHDPEVALMDRNSASDFGFHHASALDEWKYSVKGRCFYRFDNVSRKIDCRPF